MSDRCHRVVGSGCSVTRVGAVAGGAVGGWGLVPGFVPVPVTRALPERKQQPGARRSPLRPSPTLGYLHRAVWVIVGVVRDRRSPRAPAAAGGRGRPVRWWPCLAVKRSSVAPGGDRSAPALMADRHEQTSVVSHPKSGHAPGPSLWFLHRVPCLVRPALRLRGGDGEQVVHQMPLVAARPQRVLGESDPPADLGARRHRQVVEVTPPAGSPQA